VPDLVKPTAVKREIARDILSGATSSYSSNSIII
jgi:hypothetical protein